MVEKEVLIKMLLHLTRAISTVQSVLVSICSSLLLSAASSSLLPTSESHGPTVLPVPTGAAASPS